MGQKARQPRKHLTLSDRFYIEQELLQGSSFKKIGGMLHKDPTTISKEVRRNAKNISGRLHRFNICNNCRNYPDCRLRGSDPEIHCASSGTCTRACRYCWNKDLSKDCERYDPWCCDRTEHPPYVCNACEVQKHCKLPKRLYQARAAQRKYEQTLTDSRKGINMTPEELLELNDLISPLILKGQPLSHIFAVHADEIPVSRRTLYK